VFFSDGAFFFISSASASDDSLLHSDYKIGFSERAVAAAGAAVVSAVLVNPLDVAKVTCRE
jgi:solute carrier family 25, member 39/40